MTSPSYHCEMQLRADTAKAVLALFFIMGYGGAVVARLLPWQSLRAPQQER